MIKQFFFIASGFLIGQGSMFLVQTYFALDLNFEVISNLGIGLGLLSLMQWASDGGGVFLLSRLRIGSNTYKLFSNFIFARFIFSIFFYFLCFIILSNIDLGEFISDITQFLPVIAIVWVFNITGFVDKLNKNHINGMFSGLNWLFSSISVLIFYDQPNVGLYVGASYCFGALVTLVIQYVFIYKIFKFSKGNVFSSKIFFIFLKQIFGYNLAYISSQSYARLVPIIVSSYIGVGLAGIYIYSKNLANTASQFVFFSRRVEFARIKDMTTNGGVNLRNIISAQKISIITTLLLVLSSSTFYFFMLFFQNDDLQNLSEFIFFQFVVMALWLTPSTFGQIFIAKGLFNYYGLILFLTSAFSIFLIYVTIPIWCIYAVFISEIVMLLIQSVVYYFFLVKFNVKKNNLV